MKKKRTKTPIEEKDMLSRGEVAVMLGVTPVLVDWYRTKGHLPGVQYIPEGNWKYKRTDVEKLLQGK